MDILKPYTADLLFEIGVEEMPSTPLDAARVQLEALARTALEQARLDYKDLQVYSTPRRLALLVSGLAQRQKDSEIEYKGPSKAIAYDAEGNATKALEGFARGKGIDLATIELRDSDGTEYTYAIKQEKGLPARDVLPSLLQGLITGIDWPKKQRWGSSEVAFIRPVRWILAILGADTIPLNFGDLESSNYTYGHRFLSTQRIPIQAMREYKNVLRGNKVIVDHNRRREMIVEGINQQAAPHGTALVPEKVLAEVVNLCEFPNALLCSFDPEFLRVPREILEYAMNAHQRYFAIQTESQTEDQIGDQPKEESLDHHFVVISNGDPACAPVIAAGNESVMRARLADAAFFYDEDLKVGLDGWKKRLATLLFQQNLGTMADKTARIEKLVAYLCDTLAVPDDLARDGQRAAQLAKADLSSNTVVEFTELQGIVGSYYASQQGENPEVARAIAQHYWPRYAGDTLPESLPAQLVALADKVDTITGIIAAGFAPKGSSDPYALRRAAIGVLRIVMDQLPLDIADVVTAAAGQLPSELQTDGLTQQVLDFFASRSESILRDCGYSSEVVAAVLATVATRPADAALRCAALQDFTSSSDAWENLSVAYTRAKNLSDPEVGDRIDTDLLAESDQNFYSALTEAQPRIAAYLDEHAYADYLQQLADLRASVDDFFDNAMIMTDDQQLRRNRLALLNLFIALIEPFADLRRLSK
ncbi:MAG: glycine--tRNA ligase subunit beta [Coriobacteriia bacterium]|nr:glycine--tRNA ligase subunit beta [Coriobacteriia bacterium]